MVNSQFCCEIIILEANAEEGSYEQFVGNSPRVESSRFSMRCLYNRNLDSETRIKYGLTEDVSATLYLAPQLLFNQLGTWRLDNRKIKVIFLEEEYLVNRIQYIGHFPKWNQCLAVELRLVDSIHGGP